MATLRWIGRAQAIAQVDTVTVANTWAQNDTVTLTINDKDLVITIGTLVTTAQVATTIKQAWENETLTDTDASFTPAKGGQDIVEHAEITATVDASVVTLTHDSAGTPFTLSVTESTAGDGTATEATATTATGPNFWDNVDNWDTGAAPADTDSVYIDNSDISILYNIEPNLGAGSESLALLSIGQNFTGTIGLPQQNEGGYVEYRPTYLKVEADSVIVGRGDGAGSGRIKLDTDSETTSILVENTGTPLEFGLEAFLWKGADDDNSLIVKGGSVGVARFGGETATLDILRVTNALVRCGAGADFNGATSGNKIVNNENGTLEFASVGVNVTNTSGTMIVLGSATIGILNVLGGTVDYRSTGTITTANIGGASIAALLEFGNSNALRTITTCNLNPNGSINDPGNTATFTVAVGSEVRNIAAT